MTQIQIVSDLHLDKNRLKISDIVDYLYNSKKPILNLALLGNIGMMNPKRYEEFLKAVATKYKNIFLLAGNMDFYSVMGPNCKTMNEIEKDIIQICTRISNVYYLKRNCLYLSPDNNVSLKPNPRAIKIIGTTLWSHIPKSNQLEVTRLSADYQCIFSSKTQENGEWVYQKLTAEKSSAIFRENAKWLIAERKKVAPNQKVLVLTHHAPTFKNTLEENQMGIVRYTHASQLDKLISPPIKVWAFGHTLSEMDMTKKYVRLVNNPLRYLRDLKKTERNQFNVTL